MAVPNARPLQREIRTLIGALIVFLGTLIVTLLALAVSILRMDRLAATADTARATIAPLANTISQRDLGARLELLRAESGIARVEVYRGDDLYASAGTLVRSAEVLARPLPGGTILCYFDVSGWMGGRRSALIVAALATMATISGLLLLILYVPKFVRPLEDMLAHASQLGGPQPGDDDARYLVQSFREAVERIQRQSNEIEQLRDAASSRAPDIRELAGAIHRSFSSGFVAVDAHGSVVAINDAGRAILGVAGDAAERGLALDELPAPFADLVRSSLGARVGFTRREVLLAGSESLVGVTTVPLFEGEVFLGLFALFTDLSTFRAMEGRLRDLENLIGLGQMSAGIAHEFRNSLFTILGYLRLAERSATPEAVAKIRNAASEAQRLSAAVDALLNFARPLTIRAQRLRLDELLREVVARTAEEARDIAFTTNVEAAVEVHGDRELLERMLDNILRNAVDAVRQQHPDGGGTIAASTRAEPHPLVVIRDNGIGLDPAAAATLLLPFQSQKSHGFGLGLPLARKIALHHGATLNLDGAPGEGAAVTIEFFP
ncbi:MAG TPA: ATP-binding protein [Thermoanaerobaculia bacterium]|jgi:signal transduction histidine kinase